MNRKLHNTTMALIASSSLFVLGLLAGRPAPEPSTTASIAEAASFDADKAVAAETLDAGIERSDARARQHARRPRQSVSMPFFSFAPRG